MKKTFKYRLLAKQQTFVKATDWLILCQQLYNAALEQRINFYRQRGVAISCYNQIKQLPELRANFPEYEEVGSQVLQDVIERLDKTFKAFFSRIKNGQGKAGFPRFKSKDRYDSFTLKQTGWRLEDKYLSIRNIGRFKLRLSRPVEGIIKTVTIHRERSGHWYVCFACDYVPERKLTPCEKSVGIHMSSDKFCTDSDEACVENPGYFIQAEKRLRIAQRILSRRVKGSHRREKARVLLAKKYEKITNQRDYFLHKLANKYIAGYGAIYLEDVNINSADKNQENHSVTKIVQDASWGKFFELLNYKAEEAGRSVIKVPYSEIADKTCSACGEINSELTLGDTKWVCITCGVLHDSASNIAKNILRVGQTL
jgi:putative transposase